MLLEFENYVRKNKLFTKNDRLLLALSGGQDSICLFHLLLKHQYRFAVAHCNFQLRGQDSLKDELFIVNLAKKHHIDYHTIRFDTATVSKQLKLSTQETARQLRYQWFDTLRTTHAYHYILTAHHLGDNTETMLINMLRSTGVSGLHGIPLKQNFLVRPLLFFEQDEIRAFVKKSRWSFRSDSSNDSDDYLRNQIRHHVVPALHQISAETHHAFAKVAEHVREYELFSENLLDILKSKHVKKVAGGYFIKSDIFKSFKETELLLYYLIKPYGFNRSVSKSFRKIPDWRVGVKHESEHWVLCSERDGLSILKKEKNDTSAILISSNTFTLKTKHVQIRVKPVDIKDINYQLKNVLFLDAARCIFPLTLRVWKSGDKMQPLGMQGSKKISDILTDKKIPHSLRKKQMVLVNGDQQIAGLCPSFCSEQFKINSRSKGALAVHFKTL